MLRTTKKTILSREHLLCVNTYTYVHYYSFNDNRPSFPVACTTRLGMTGTALGNCIGSSWALCSHILLVPLSAPNLLFCRICLLTSVREYGGGRPDQCERALLPHRGGTTATVWSRMQSESN